jgi:outer membrane protein
MERPGGKNPMTAVQRRERRARIAFGLSLLISVPFAARAEEPTPPPQALTLQQALRRALEANASTATARSQVTASEAEVRQLRNSILPHFDLDTAVTRNSREVAFDVNGFRATLLPLWDWSARINLSQPIYAGQREHMALRQGRLTVTSNQAAVRSAEDMVLLATASDYLGILQGQDLVAVEQRNLELAGRRRKQAQAFYEAGEQTKVDVLRADTDSKAAERALAEAQRSRDLASSRLRLDIALDQPAAPLAPIQAQAPNLKFPPLPPAEMLIADAEASRATVQRAQLALEIATLETRKQGAARLPTVRAEGDILRQRTTFPADQTAALTIRLTMPIFDSGEISAKVAVAREQQRQAEIALAEARRQVREDVLQALLNLRTAETDLALAKEQLAAAEAEYNQSFELYRAQEATSLDLQTAETSLASARRAVVNGTVNRDLAEVNVWSAAGTLKKLILEEGAQ